MGLKIKIDPIAKDVAVAIRDDLSRPAQQRVAADFARKGFEEAQSTNRQVLGRIPLHTVHVDGRENAPLETVNPDRGSIIFEWELVTDVLRWIAETLVARSPHSSGNYRRSHTLFADGREIHVGGQIPEAAEYAFTNTVPYARKIEIGKTTAGRSFVIQVPNRIYERTAEDARGRFGNLAKIQFSFRGIVAGAQVNPAKAGGSRAHNAPTARYPTIIVRIN